MKICLATAHATREFTPLSLLYLKAQLVQEQVVPPGNVAILEFAAKAVSPEELAKKVLETAPDIVGFSCYVWNVRTILDACRLLRQARPGIRLVLGGPEVGPVASRVLQRNPAVDVVVMGEGEQIFARLVVAWRDGNDIGELKGICHRVGEAVVDAGTAPILGDLGAIAPPYQFDDFEARGRNICIETQRGCVFRCSFCFYNKDLSVRNRRFPMDRVKEEIRHWLQRDIAEIYLMDPIFNLHADRAKEILRFIVEHNTRRIPLHTEIWAEFVDEEMAALMHAANFRFVEVGLQTTDTAVLATVDRRLRMSRFRAGIEHLRRAMVPFELQLIVGLPGESMQSFRTSLNFAASLHPTRLAVFPLLVLPGTELHRTAGILGVDYDPEPPYEVRSHPRMSRPEVAHGIGLAKAVQHVGNLWTLRLLAREGNAKFDEVMEAWLTWSERQGIALENPGPDAVRAFAGQYCAEKGIPPTFYLKSLEAELASVPAA